MFGKLVRQESRGRKQQDERQQDQAVYYGGEHHLLLPVVALENGVLDDDLVAQVDEGVEEHHGDVGDEAFLF